MRYRITENSVNKKSEKTGRVRGEVEKGETEKISSGGRMEGKKEPRFVNQHRSNCTGFHAPQTGSKWRPVFTWVKPEVHITADNTQSMLVLEVT